MIEGKRRERAQGAKARKPLSERCECQKILHAATVRATRHREEPVRGSFFVVGDLDHTFALASAHTRISVGSHQRLGTEACWFGVGLGVLCRVGCCLLVGLLRGEVRGERVVIGCRFRVGVCPGQTLDERFANV